jgi:hypothetical protein
MGRARGLLGIQTCCYRNRRVIAGRCSRTQLGIEHHFPSYTRFKWRRVILLGEESYPRYSPNEVLVGHSRRHTFPTSRSGRTLVQKRISSRGSFCWPVRTPTVALCNWYDYSLPQEIPKAMASSINPRRILMARSRLERRGS